MNSLLGTAGFDAQLAQTLATLAAEKRTIVTPAQIIHDLPQERDDALRIARGGSILRRITRAAACAVAAKAAH
jgi:hypothetical protein